MLSLILKHPIIFKDLLTEAHSTCGMIQKCFKYNKNISSALIIRTFVTRNTRLSDGLAQSASFLKPNKLSQNLIRHQQMKKLDVNTNVRNNVILYKNECDRYFRNIKIIAIGQLLGWSMLAFCTYTSAFFDIFTTDIKLKEFVKQHAFRLIIFVFSIFAGPCAFAFIYALCARSIRYIILNKGGKTLSLSTYHWRKKKSNIINLPIEMAKCTSHRMDRGVCIAFKIKNKSLFYLIDKKGVFVNPTLFDEVMI
ncbi:transmembrane protein 223-like [Camponotus floridanus]|uniref:transmembrane protein 223-like n=1 Tax=Camponotus floridanus TaxID=104421 RepID=UPI00059DC06E|nr:transmembrane protein 223-like [Camponotus floridanus]